MITGFQFRAAKAICKLTAKEIATDIGLHQITLLRFGKTKNLEYLNGITKNVILVKNFFESKKILFPQKNSLTLKTNIEDISNSENGFSRFQLVCARIATGLTQAQLAKYAKVSSGTISSMERLENHKLIEVKKMNTFILKSFFEHIGVVFENDLTVILVKDPKVFLKSHRS